MDKKIIYNNLWLDEIIGDDYLSFRELQEKLDYFKEKGATHITLYTDEGPVYIEGLIAREETYEEYNKRIKAEEHWKNDSARREKELYLSLKEKYENS